MQRPIEGPGDGIALCDYSTIGTIITLQPDEEDPDEYDPNARMEAEMAL